MSFPPLSGAQAVERDAPACQDEDFILAPSLSCSSSASTVVVAAHVSKHQAHRSKPNQAEMTQTRDRSLCVKATKQASANQAEIPHSLSHLREARRDISMQAMSDISYTHFSSSANAIKPATASNQQHEAMDMHCQAPVNQPAENPTLMLHATSSQDESACVTLCSSVGTTSEQIKSYGEFTVTIGFLVELCFRVRASTFGIDSLDGRDSPILNCASSDRVSHAIQGMSEVRQSHNFISAAFDALLISCRSRRRIPMLLSLQATDSRFSPLASLILLLDVTRVA